MKLMCRSAVMVMLAASPVTVVAQEYTFPGAAPSDALAPGPYTIPDTAIDVQLVPPPENAPGDRVVLAPGLSGGTPEVILEIPTELLTK